MEPECARHEAVGALIENPRSMNELANGVPTGGKRHLIKAAESVTRLNKWLAGNPAATYHDILVAKSLLYDLDLALGGN
jgi:hypothetical protein